MRCTALVLACMGFAAFGHRVTIASEQIQDASDAQHQQSHNAVNATSSSHSSAELEQSQSNAQAGVPNPVKWLALLLLAGSMPADAFPPSHGSRPFAGQGKPAARQLRPAALHGHNRASINPNSWEDITSSIGFQTSDSGYGGDFAQETARAQEPRPTKVMLEEKLGHLRKTPRRFKWSSPVMNAAVIERPKLELERAPPAPPPPPSGSGGGGGPGEEGDGPVYLSRLTVSQAVEILNDWIARTRVYCMSDQFGNTANAAVAQVNRKSLEELDVLRSWSQNLQGGPTEMQKLLMALYASDKKTVLALAGVSVRWQLRKEQGALVVKYVSLNPAELNKEDSAVAPMMSEALRLMAQGLGADLINDEGE